MVVYIYALVDPSTDEIRYVGLTRNPEDRLRGHIKNHSICNPHLGNWIKKLARQGLKPRMNILEVTSFEFAGEREVYWIAYYKERGAKLTNATSGGERGYKITEESRKRRSIARTGIKRGPMPEEHKELIRQALKGRRTNPGPSHFVELNKQRAGQPLSEEHRRKVSESLKGRKMPAHAVEATRQALIARWADPEYRRAQSINNKPILDAYREIAQKKSADLRRGIRKTHCAKGHEFTSENTAWEKKSHGGIMQRCKKCKSVNNSKYKKNRRLKRLEQHPSEGRQTITES